MQISILPSLEPCSRLSLPPTSLNSPSLQFPIRVERAEKQYKQTVNAIRDRTLYIMHVVYLIHINTLTTTHNDMHIHTPTHPHTNKPWHTTPASSNLPQGYWGMVLYTQLSQVDSDPLQFTSRSSRGATSSLNTSLVRAMAPVKDEGVRGGDNNNL